MINKIKSIQFKDKRGDKGKFHNKKLKLSFYSLFIPRKIPQVQIPQKLFHNPQLQKECHRQLFIPTFFNETTKKTIFTRILKISFELLANSQASEQFNESTFLRAFVVCNCIPIDVYSARCTSFFSAKKIIASAPTT